MTKETVISLDVKDWLIIIGFLAQGLFYVFRSGWQAKAFRHEVSEEIQSYRLECGELVSKMKDEFRATLDQERRIVGEGLLSLRQRISEVELYGANEYIRRRSFHDRMNDLQAGITKSDEVVYARLQRMEDKVEHLAQAVARLTREP